MKMSKWGARLSDRGKEVDAIAGASNHHYASGLRLHRGKSVEEQDRNGIKWVYLIVTDFMYLHLLPFLCMCAYVLCIL